MASNCLGSVDIQNSLSANLFHSHNGFSLADRVGPWHNRYCHLLDLRMSMLDQHLHHPCHHAHSTSTYGSANIRGVWWVWWVWWVRWVWNRTVDRSCPGLYGWKHHHVNKLILVILIARNDWNDLIKPHLLLFPSSLQYRWI